MTTVREAAAGATAFGAVCTLPSPAAAELLALEQPDYLMIDCQHGLIDYGAMVGILQAVSGTGVTTVVRCPSQDGPTIGRMLDAGAEVVIVPMVDTRAQAEAVAAACRYAPTGTRSYGPTRAGFLVSTDPEQLMAHLMCLVMIETAEGVENADAICATTGVDGVYVGPADLAVSFGQRPSKTSGLLPGRHTEAVEHVLDRCRAHGVLPAIHAYDGETARSYADMGFRMVTAGSDKHLLRKGLARELVRARTDAP